VKQEYKRVLFVTTVFPPRYGSGTNRVIRLCKRLPSVGYSPVILTTAPKGEKEFPSADDLNISGEVIRAPLVTWKSKFGTDRSKKQFYAVRGEVGKASSKNKGYRYILFRLGQIVFHNFFEIPDFAAPWIRGAIREGARYLRENSVSVIYSTSPEVSSHYVASALSRQTGLPWIMEFRDLWLDNPWHPDYIWIRRKLDGMLEPPLIQHADRIIMVSEGNRRILEARYPLLRERMMVIPNGFDPSEYPEKPVRTEAPPLILLYTGSFYQGRRDITGLLQAIQYLSQREPHLSELLQIRIAGDYENYAVSRAKQMGLHAFVKDLGMLSPSNALVEQSSAHILLIVEASENTEWVYGNLTGKLFEYLGASQPIMALVNHASSIAQVVQETHTGVVIDPKDWKNIADYLEGKIKQLRESGRLSYSHGIQTVNQYNWASLIERVGKVLNELS
jgi:glycosyltransferase involved in cell wall biosynthesis